MAVGPPFAGSSWFVMVFSAAVIWLRKLESTLMDMTRDVENARVEIDGAKRAVRRRKDMMNGDLDGIDNELFA
jgi:hypothetical protein